MEEGDAEEREDAKRRDRMSEGTECTRGERDDRL